MKSKVHPVSSLKDNYIWMIEGPDSKLAVVDPSTSEDVENYLEQNKKTLSHVLLTHHHWDHTGGVEALKRKYQCQVWGAVKDQHRLPNLDLKLQDKDETQLFNFRVQVLEIPGHTLGHIAYFFPTEKWVFVGDTLFSLGCGRLFEGSPEMMLSSLGKLSLLADEVQVFCGHEYTLQNAQFALQVDPQNTTLREHYTRIQSMRECGIPTLPSNIGLEKRCNPFMRCQNRDLQKSLGITDSLALFTDLRKRKDCF